MIEAIALRNIRIFTNADFPFVLKPLTLLCGTNSSGKSTLLKSILLLKQSQSPRARYESPQGEIQVIGPQLDLGNFNNVVSNNDANNDATISIKLDVTEELSVVSPWQLRRSPTQTRNPFIISSTFTFGIPHHHRSATTDLPPLGDQDAAAPLCLVKRATHNLTGVNIRLRDFTVILANEDLSPDDAPRYELIIPKGILRSRGDVSKFSLGEIDGQLRFAIALDGLFPTTLLPASEVIEGGSSQSLRRQVRHFYMPPEFEPMGPLFLAGRMFDMTMSKLGYVGPARAAAKRYYYSTRSSLSGIDPTGEFLPHTLLGKKNQDVEYVAPDCDGLIRKEKLPVALARWIQYMRDGKFVADKPPAKEYKVDTPDNIMLSVKLKAGNSDKLFPLADIGFGYSQVLPILINGLLYSRA